MDTCITYVIDSHSFRVIKFPNDRFSILMMIGWQLLQAT